MKNHKFIGKEFRLKNIDNSIMTSFIIKYVKEDVIPEQRHEDGSYSGSYKDVLVSENGSGWYRVDSSSEVINPIKRTPKNED